MRTKKFIIWDSEVNMEDWKDFLETDREEYPEAWEGKDPELYAEQRVSETNRSYLDDERYNLNCRLPNPILVIGDLGLWHGRVSAYKIISSGNIRDILCPTCDGKCKWYSDGNNICGQESHHDGVNRYVYREIRDMCNIQNLLDKIYAGEKISSSVLNYYTRSIVSDVGRVYGLCD